MNNLAHLVLEEERVFAQSVVEHKVIVERGRYQVDDGPSHRHDDEEGDELPQRRVLRPCGWVHILGEEVLVAHVEHSVHGCEG